MAENLENSSRVDELLVELLVKEILDLRTVGIQVPMMVQANLNKLIGYLDSHRADRLASTSSPQLPPLPQVPAACSDELRKRINHMLEKAKAEKGKSDPQAGLLCRMRRRLEEVTITVGFRNNLCIEIFKQCLYQLEYDINICLFDKGAWNLN